MGHVRKLFCHSVTMNKPLRVDSIKCVKILKNSGKMKLEHLFHFLGREMVDSIFLEHTG
jgi:hypothetical protein